MIRIYTLPPKVLSRERIKLFIASILGKKRGPQAVLDSLLRGLESIGEKPLVNPLSSARITTDTVHILSSPAALAWAVDQKSLGKIRKIIAGPNIVITPNDFNNLLQRKEIDIILVPSRWVADFYISLAPQIKDKIAVWPSGVMVPTNISDISPRNTKKCIIYIKDLSCKYTDDVVAACKEKSFEPTIIKYGEHTQSKYYSHLASSDFMIYIGKAESQGLGLQEAWARNVPTLVFNTKTWTDGTHTWSDPKISAPYLSEKTGMFFESFNNFEITITQFIDRLPSFKPQAEVIDTLSDTASARAYLDKIK